MKNLVFSLIIWSISFAAITAGASLTYTWYKERGPLIQIVFQHANGLMPDQSKIVYRGVQVGTVTAIWLEKKEEGVIVVARMTKQAAKLMGKDSRFWIVRPEFGLDKISNLSAIATGDYIEMDPIAGEASKKFIGLKQPPAEHPRLATGLRLVLKAVNLGGLNDESPILYHGLQIGNVWEINLSQDKKHVDLTVYIYKEYGDVIRRSSYFSNISGFHANIHLFGASQISMDSLSTLLRGGIAVSTPKLSGPKAKDGEVFNLLTAEQAQEIETNS